jgi:2-polyprenyl-3-methyl-5-hydroxy-6-metoxy-1,4-benzoquinol methylase
MRYFVKPPSYAYSSDNSTHYFKGYKTYSDYNYLRPGIMSFIKTLHFEVALKLTEGYFYKANAIDFGCADGVFIPSLSKYYVHTCGIDNNLEYLKSAAEIVDALDLGNVELLCNSDLETSDLKSRLSDRKYHVLYLLETLEHIGDNDSLYESEIRFLQEIVNLLEKDGVIVVSVPVMVGIPFLIQRLGLILTRSFLEPLAWRDFFMAVMFNNTDDLEKRWHGGHLGFNHRKLEKRIKNCFRILRKRHLGFQVLYLLGK